MDKKVLDSIVDLSNKDIINENANMASATPAGIMHKFASVHAKEYAHDYLLSDKARTAVDDNLIHIHDLDYYPTRSLTCLQHPLDRVLSGGFIASDGTARPCKRIETAGALAAISIQTISNEQHGGQSIPAFDFYMSPYVRITFEEEYEKACKLLGDEWEEGDGRAVVIDEYVVTSPYDFDGELNSLKVAINQTVKRVHQTMEAFIHNMNTMRSRGGNQTPFSSINYGTDTSPEGRLVIRELLKSTYKGVGNGQTAIFPIQVFKVKTGVNRYPEDPNYDLRMLAAEVTAKRFFPNYINLDVPFNQYDKWDINDPKRYMYEPATMGCRTRVFENRFGDNTSVGRGNLSFTTINLPRLALEAKNYAEFLERLEETVDIAVNQLIERFEFQCEGLKSQFPMLMSGMWVDSEKLEYPDSEVRDVIKHGTMAVGFIGLAECLKVLTGLHHGESERAQNVGLAIVTEMRDRCKYWADKLDLNISLLATPAEGLAGKFVVKDREKFGVIKGVTDKDFYTNSNHVPVEYKISYVDKLRIEAPYHALTLGGHIAYVEVDGNIESNSEAIMDIVDTMLDLNIGYGSINFARARCLDCGFEDGSTKFETCPKCGSAHVDVLERITGYLVGGMSKWNHGKREELKHRVSHMTGDRIIQ